MDPNLKGALTETLDAVERLLNLFRVERMVHLLIGVVAFGMLVYAIALLFKGGVTTQLLVCLFGSSGLITVSSARITYFFNRAFKLVEEVILKLLESGVTNEQTKSSITE
jgi:phosphoglycerol transferase MdoB-like AlkP superfamily enzyme